MRRYEMCLCRADAGAMLRHGAGGQGYNDATVFGLVEGAPTSAFGSDIGPLGALPRPTMSK